MNSVHQIQKSSECTQFVISLLKWKGAWQIDLPRRYLPLLQKLCRKISYQTQKLKWTSGWTYLLIGTDPASHPAQLLNVREPPTHSSAGRPIPTSSVCFSPWASTWAQSSLGSFRPKIDCNYIGERSEPLMSSLRFMIEWIIKGYIVISILLGPHIGTRACLFLPPPQNPTTRPSFLLCSISRGGASFGLPLVRIRSFPEILSIISALIQLENCDVDSIRVKFNRGVLEKLDLASSSELIWLIIWHLHWFGMFLWVFSRVSSIFSFKIWAIYRSCNGDLVA